TPLRSSNAIPDNPSFAARSAMCSGEDAPRKKLKALQACNSTYCSVIDAFDLPLAAVFPTTTDAPARQLQIPLRALPPFLIPPVAGSGIRSLLSHDRIFGRRRTPPSQTA